MMTVKPELEELCKEMEVKWPGLSFFNAKGDLNDFGKIAEKYLELEKTKDVVTIDVRDCVDKRHYHIMLCVSSYSKKACDALAMIHKNGGSVITSFFDEKMKDVKEVTLQLSRSLE